MLGLQANLYPDAFVRNASMIVQGLQSQQNGALKRRPHEMLQKLWECCQSGKQYRLAGSLVLRMLQFSPESRVSAKKALASGFFDE